MTERPRDLNRVKAAALTRSREWVREMRKAGTELKRFGVNTWKELSLRRARAEMNAYYKRHGRSYHTPHAGAAELARAQREGSPAWHAW